jgi:hypothetical protein
MRELEVWVSFLFQQFILVGDLPDPARIGISPYIRGVHLHSRRGIVHAPYLRKEHAHAIESIWEAIAGSCRLARLYGTTGAATQRYRRDLTTSLP